MATGEALAGKVAVVTGGGSGIGRATAAEMARRGASVTIADVDDQGGPETVELVEAVGGEAIFVHTNVCDSQDVSSTVAATVDRFGRLDILHNNAGVHETALTASVTVEDLPEDVWDRVMDVNVKGTWRFARAALPHLREYGGSIVNAGSTASHVGYPMASAYCTSKGAILQLTRAMATEWAKYGIRVNCYCPGTVSTKMVSGYWESAEDPEAVKAALGAASLVDRLGEPDEVAKLICFLASDEASFITGAIYTVDGGVLAWRGENPPPVS